jgi:hypothetical protein
MRRVLVVISLSFGLLAGVAVVVAPQIAVAETPGGLRLDASTTTLSKGKPVPIELRVLDRSGKPVTKFQPELTKLMHFILVRDDLTGYQHVHPTLGGDGVFHINLTIPDAGRYRAVADIKTGGKLYTLTANLTVPGKAKRALYPAVAPSSTVSGFEVALEHGPIKAQAGAHLVFKVSRGGKPVTALQPYLGAYGHLVAFRMSNLAYAHVHPMGRQGNEISFHAVLAQPGYYRFFLQFRTGGEVYTAPFSVEVAAADEAPPATVTVGTGGSTPPTTLPDDGGGHNH